MKILPTGEVATELLRKGKRLTVDTAGSAIVQVFFGTVTVDEQLVSAGSKNFGSYENDVHIKISSVSGTAKIEFLENYESKKSATLTTLTPFKNRGYIAIGDSILGLGNSGGSNITSLTSTGGIATAVVSASGLQKGMRVNIANAVEADYNGYVTVLSASGTQFTYAVPLSTPSTATTLTVFVWIADQKFRENNIAKITESLSQQKFRLLGNQAVGGDRIAGTTARLAAAFNPANNIYNETPTGCFLCVGVNDAIGDRTISQMKTDYITLLDSLNQYVDVIIFIMPLGFSVTVGTYTLARATVLANIRTWLRDYIPTHYPKVIISNADRTVIDPATGNYKAGYSNDGIHLSNTSAYFIGKDINNKIFSKLAEIGSINQNDPRAFYDAVNNPNGPYLFENPTMQGAGGIISGSASGVGPNNTVTTTLGATGTVVSSVKPKADGTGNNHKLVIDVTAGTNFSVKITTSAANYNTRFTNPGDRMYQEVTIAATNVVGALRYFQFAQLVIVDGVTSTYDAISAAGVEVFGDANFLLRLRTPIYTQQVGQTGLYPQIWINFNGVGAGTFEISDWNIINLSKL